jgi:hypothetical protein
MNEPYEPLTPVQVEQRLRQMVNDLARATRDLGAARDAEVAAKHRYEDAHRRALLSDDCPKVTRGGYTTAERDAWVETRAAVLQRAYDLAEVARRAAEDHLRTLREQAVVISVIAKSVNAAYMFTGVDR